MKALTIDEMYRLRKWTRSSRRYWGQQRPDKNTGHEQPSIAKRVRSRIYCNLLVLLVIAAVVVVAALVGVYVK